MGNGIFEGAERADRKRAQISVLVDIKTTLKEYGDYYSLDMNVLVDRKLQELVNEMSERYQAPPAH